MVYLTDDVIKSGMTSLKVGEAQSKSLSLSLVV